MAKRWRVRTIPSPSARPGIVCRPWVRVPRRVALFGLWQDALPAFTAQCGQPWHRSCPERLPDREFLSYIWNFEKRYAPLFIQSIDRYGPNVPVAVLHSHREMAQLLQMSSNF